MREIVAPTTTSLLSNAHRGVLRATLSILIATHPELEDQARALLIARPSGLTGGITTVAPLQALRAGWCYQDPDSKRWYRIVEIDPDTSPDAPFREAITEEIFGLGNLPALDRICRADKIFTVKIPENQP